MISETPANAQTTPPAISPPFGDEAGGVKVCAGIPVEERVVLWAQR
jgi:hypothetical protein